MKYFKVRILRATKLTFGNDKVDPFHVDKIGKVILVKKASYEGSPYYHCKTGESILRHDVEPIKKVKEKKKPGIKPYLDNILSYRYVGVSKF
jgi:hypothetical protein